MRKIGFWVQLYSFPEGDRLTREEDYPFYLSLYPSESNGEDEFAEMVDAELLKWIEKHKDFGVKEYGWKYLETP